MNPSKHRVTVLLVDDDPSMVRLLRGVLKRSFGEQLALESLTDPAAAQARLEEGGVDVLLTDLEMPGIDGLELLRRAKRRNVYTQVLLLTGHSTQQALLEAFELGATDYLIKPFEPETVADRVAETVRRQQRWKEALVQTWQHQRQSVAATD